MKNQISNQLRAQLAHLEADSLRQLISRAQAMRDRSDKRPKEPLDTWVQRALRQEDRRREAIQDTQLGQVIGTFGNTCRAEVDRRVFDVAFAGSFCIVGDWIRFGENKTGEQQVVEVLPRRTKLSRPDVGGANKEKLIVANVDRVVIVVSVVSPPLHPRLIDRYLVAIQQGGAKPLLCVNKIDLLEDRSELDVLEPYRLAGVEIIVLSTRTQEGTAQLREALTGQTCVFVGHSGVGKSSLVNALLATPTQEVRGVSEGLWRRFPHIKENGNLYPTHGLGPVAQYMNVNRGDRFETLVSLSSREASLTEYRDRTQPADSAKRKEKYRCGDMNTSIIRTAKGRTVMLQHDVVTPRPYTRHNMISGTKGTFADYPARIYLDRMGDDSWHDLKEFTDKYEHPYWRKNGELARKSGGHGGMDFIMAYRLIETMRQGDVPDIDVYDTAAWSAPKALSEASVKRGGAPQAFPDFTRGDWDVKPK